MAILGLFEGNLCPMYPKGTLSIYASIFTFRDGEVSNLPAIGMKFFSLRTTGMSTINRETLIYISHIYMLSTHPLISVATSLSSQAACPPAEELSLAIFQLPWALNANSTPTLYKHPCIGSKHALPSSVYCPVYALYCVDRINYSSMNTNSIDAI